MASGSISAFDHVGLAAVLIEEPWAGVLDGGCRRVEPVACCSRRRAFDATELIGTWVGIVPRLTAALVFERGVRDESSRVKRTQRARVIT